MVLVRSIANLSAKRLKVPRPDAKSRELHDSPSRARRGFETRVSAAAVRTVVYGYKFNQTRRGAPQNRENRHRAPTPSTRGSPTTYEVASLRTKRDAEPDCTCRCPGKITPDRTGFPENPYDEIGRDRCLARKEYGVGSEVRGDLRLFY